MNLSRVINYAVKNNGIINPGVLKAVVFDTVNENQNTLIVTFTKSDNVWSSSKTYAEVASAVSANVLVLAKYGDDYYPVTDSQTANQITFGGLGAYNSSTSKCSLDSFTLAESGVTATQTQKTLS